MYDRISIEDILKDISLEILLFNRTLKVLFQIGKNMDWTQQNLINQESQIHFTWKLPNPTKFE